MPKATKQEGFELVQIPEDVYPMKLVDVTGKKKDGSEIDGQFGPMWKWTFEILDGQHKGVQVVAFSSKKFSVPEDRGANVDPSKAVIWAETLLGRQIKSGESIEWSDIIGKECKGFVEFKPTGGTDKDGNPEKQSQVTKVKPK